MICNNHQEIMKKYGTYEYVACEACGPIIVKLRVDAPRGLGAAIMRNLNAERGIFR